MRDRSFQIVCQNYLINRTGTEHKTTKKAIMNQQLCGFVHSSLCMHLFSLSDRWSYASVVQYGTNEGARYHFDLIYIFDDKCNRIYYIMRTSHAFSCRFKRPKRTHLMPKKENILKHTTCCHFFDKITILTIDLAFFSNIYIRNRVIWLGNNLLTQPIQQAETSLRMPAVNLPPSPLSTKQPLSLLG